MDYKKTAQEIYEKVGKKENLVSAAHCATRLRLVLADNAKCDAKAVEDIDGVKGVFSASGQLQIILGTGTVNKVYDEFIAISGLTAATAKNLVKYREENGAFTTRKQLLKVPKLGPKAFEQCAGFLRVPESKSPLDNTAVHPESYAAAERLLELTRYSLADVSNGGLGDLDQRIRACGAEQLAAACGVGVPTLLDVAKELQKPGRDPRDELPPPVLRTDILEIKDLRPGMVLTGTVRNVIDFGVFVDIGVHQDGLVHISQITDKFLKHPSEAVAVGDVVKVAVLEVDEKKKRISLSMKQANL